MKLLFLSLLSVASAFRLPISPSMAKPAAAIGALAVPAAPAFAKCAGASCGAVAYNQDIVASMGLAGVSLAGVPAFLPPIYFTALQSIYAR